MAVPALSLTTVFAIGNLHPQGLGVHIHSATLLRKQFHGGNFSIAVPPQPVFSRPILWATRRWDDLPSQRTVEIAHCAEAIGEFCAAEPDIAMAYGECSRSNERSCIGAQCRQLAALPARRIAFFDLHSAAAIEPLRGKALQLPSIELWAAHAKTFSPPIDAVVSPDLGRMSDCAALAKLLAVECFAIDKKLPAGKSPLPPKGCRALVFDDEIVSGRTLSGAIGRLRDAGALSIDVAVSYALCQDKVLLSLAKEPGLRSLFVGDLIQRPARSAWGTLSLASPLLERFMAVRDAAT
ncbi:MAG: phosphoribosyltransferase [Puniceicoccales bacterium]|nr:phosphoribosyltransferase [Puniceicoccales bacterium]